MHDQIREQKVSDMISRKLRFQPVHAFGIRHSHDGGIIDQSIDRLRISVDFGAGFADLFLGAEIELEEASGNGGGEGLEDGFCGLQFGQVAAGENEEGGVVMG